MASTSTKRKAPSHASNLINSRKRQKLQKEKDKSAKKQPKNERSKEKRPEKKLKSNLPSSPQSTSAKYARVIDLDDLKWSEVNIPDQLDDYEGFFGLEEVENVEVVRHADSGKVSFKTPDHLSIMGKEVGDTEGADTYTTVASALKTVQNGVTASEEEWIGFSDVESKDSVQQKLEKGPKIGKRIPGEGPKSELKKSKQVTSTSAPEPIGSIPFAGLLDESMDEGVDTSEWKSLNLAPETLSALSTMRFARPTPIQRAAIPEIMAGHDVVGKASTGSGKTLAFGIPILERFLQTPKPKEAPDKEETVPLALVLAPTRELAHQIGKHLITLCNQEGFEGPRIATITGGLSIQKQQRQLVTADVIIGTPGRLWEVMSGGHGIIKKIKQIQFLIVDEADRLLSEGHFKEVEEILDALDREEQREEIAAEGEDTKQKDRQTLVFSATFHKGLQQKLAGKSRPSGDLMAQQESMEYLLKKLRFQEEKPKFIDVNPDSQMASRLKEGLVECAGTEKDLYLYALLMLHPKTRTLIFTNSISAVRRITPYLQHLNQPAQGLHSNMMQRQRLRAIERFKSSESAILVATDVAARGLDIPGVQLVVHYHLPRTADMYVHRSGRTARAENKGSSIIICAPEEVMGVKRLVAKVHSQSGVPSEGKYSIRSLDMDRRVVARLKPRAVIAKKIADVGIAKEKGNASDQLFQEAAADLGVEYDSEEFEGTSGGRSGRGNQRKKKEREERSVGKDQMGAWKAELRELLRQRVNVGVSERYLTSGTVDIEALLRGERGEFLGAVGGLGLDD